MKALRIVIAVILTIALLYIARNNSRGRPEYFSHNENGYTFEYNSVPKGLEFERTKIPLTIEGDINENAWPMLRRSRPGQIRGADPATFDIMPMSPCDTAANCYFAEVTAGARNGRFYYYIEVVDSTGAALATFTQPDGSPFMFRFIGAVPSAITLTHIVLIFATVFFISMAAMHALALIKGGTDVMPMAKYSLLAAVCAFLGGYPFGIPMNWYAFGGTWEGVPFGTDATDNKTQLLFVYLLFVTLATLGTLTKNKWGKDLYSPKALGWFAIGSFAVMWFIYLIPHSIQFSPTLTYAFCYSWIGVVFLLYLIGRLRSARA
ncbi:MAG: hypothetical protein AB1483_08410 [Candidatus Zixiibacteriota bacterium]